MHCGNLKFLANDILAFDGLKIEPFPPISLLRGNIATPSTTSSSACQHQILLLRLLLHFVTLFIHTLNSSFPTRRTVATSRKESTMMNTSFPQTGGHNLHHYPKKEQQFKRPKMMEKSFHSLPSLYSPSIVPSVTQDEHEEFHNHDDDHHDPSSLRNVPEIVEYNAEKFLNLYEQMLATQDKEHSATIAYLRPILEILESSSSSSSTYDDDNDYHNGTSKTSQPFQDHHQFCMSREIQYSTLKQAIFRIEHDDRYDFIRKDAQLSMVLNTLAKQNVFASGEEEEGGGDAFISWGEIVQCYKACVLGMQTLQGVPMAGYIRNRTCDRSKSMVLTFKTPKGQHKEKSSSHHRRLQSRKVGKTSTAGHETQSSYVVLLMHLVAAFCLGMFLTGSFGIISSPISMMFQSPPSWEDTSSLLLLSTASNRTANVPRTETPLAETVPGAVLPKGSQPTSSSSNSLLRLQMSRARPLIVSQQERKLREQQQEKFDQQKTPQLSSSMQSTTTLSTQTATLATPGDDLTSSQRQSLSSSFLEELSKLNTPTQIGMAVGSTAAVVGITGSILVRALSAVSAGSSSIPVGIVIVAGTILANGIQGVFARLMKRLKKKRKNLSEP